MALESIIQRRFVTPAGVASLLRNRWPPWIGISGHNASEYAATDLTFYDRQKCALEEHFISSPKTLLRIIPADKGETSGNDNEVLYLESVQDT